MADDHERLSNVSRKRHLPDELCREILLRLPAKSLLRFRCVSKTWLSLIDDPKFCRVHLESFKNNSDETHLLALEHCVETRCAVRCSDTFEPDGKRIVALPTRCQGGFWRTKSSLDGLVVLQKAYRHNIIVWNPSIRKFHEIPPVPQAVTRDIDSFDVVDLVVGLVYDPSERDYKLVKFIFMGFYDLRSVVVYSLGARSWKTVKVCSNWHWRIQDSSIKAVYLRGSLYFICYEPNKEIRELVSFNLGSEEFCSVSLPSMAATVDMERLVLVASGCSSLTLFDFYLDATTVWHYGSGTEGESMFWTEQISHESFVACFLFLKKNGDILTQYCEEQVTVHGATGERLEHDCCFVSSHNLQTGEDEILLLKNEETRWDACGYIESLVLLK